MNVGAKRNRPLVESQMISLADIAFLLIFFFLLTSAFMKDRVKVDLPILPRMLKTSVPHSVTLDKSKQITFDGEVVTGKDDLEGRVKSALSGKTKPEELEIRFKCDKTMQFKDYRPVIEAISSGGGIIAIIHDTPSTVSK